MRWRARGYPSCHRFGAFFVGTVSIDRVVVLRGDLGVGFGVFRFGACRFSLGHLGVGEFGVVQLGVSDVGIGLGCRGFGDRR